MLETIVSFTTFASDRSSVNVFKLLYECWGVWVGTSIWPTSVCYRSDGFLWTAFKHCVIVMRLFSQWIVSCYSIFVNMLTCFFLCEQSEIIVSVWTVSRMLYSSTLLKWWNLFGQGALNWAFRQFQLFVIWVFDFRRYTVDCIVGSTLGLGCQCRKYAWPVLLPSTWTCFVPVRFEYV